MLRKKKKLFVSTFVQHSIVVTCGFLSVWSFRFIDFSFCIMVGRVACALPCPHCSLSSPSRVQVPFNVLCLLLLLHFVDPESLPCWFIFFYLLLGFSSLAYSPAWSRCFVKLSFGGYKAHDSEKVPLCVRSGKCPPCCRKKRK